MVLEDWFDLPARNWVKRDARGGPCKNNQAMVQSSHGAIKPCRNQAVGQSSRVAIKPWGNQAVGQSSRGAIKLWGNQAVGQSSRGVIKPGANQTRGNRPSRRWRARGSRPWRSRGPSRGQDKVRGENLKGAEGQGAIKLGGNTQAKQYNMFRAVGVIKLTEANSIK